MLYEKIFFFVYTVVVQIKNRSIKMRSSIQGYYYYPLFVTCTGSWLTPTSANRPASTLIQLFVLTNRNAMTNEKILDHILPYFKHGQIWTYSAVFAMLGYIEPYWAIFGHIE
jgi:hypothetical protein